MQHQNQSSVSLLDFLGRTQIIFELLEELLINPFNGV